MSLERIRFHEIVGALPPKKQPVRVERMDVASAKMAQDRDRMLKDMQRQIEFEEKHTAQVTAVRDRVNTRSKQKMEKYQTADTKAGDLWNERMDARAAYYDNLNGRVAYTKELKNCNERTISGTARVVNALKRRALQEGKSAYHDQAMDAQHKVMAKLGHRLPDASSSPLPARPRIKGCPYDTSPRTSPNNTCNFQELASTNASLRPLPLASIRSVSPEHGGKGRGQLTQSAVDAAVTWLRYKQNEAGYPVV